MKLSNLYLLLFCFLACVFSSVAAAQEPNWYPYVVARGQDRVVIQNTPMEYRPYRPFHFYGNTIRRTYYRGTAAPQPRDIIRMSTIVLTRTR